jgi:hypothetical protein
MIASGARAAPDATALTFVAETPSESGGTQITNTLRHGFIAVADGKSNPAAISMEAHYRLLQGDREPFDQILAALAKSADSDTGRTTSTPTIARSRPR